MGNHYHLTIEIPAADLSRGIREVNGRYTLAFNRRHRRVGRPNLDGPLDGANRVRAERNRRIGSVHLQHGYTLTEVGRHLGLHYSTSSKVVVRGDPS